MRFSHPELVGALESGAAAITPDSFLASVVRGQFDLAQLAQGRAAWNRPSVLSLNVWLRTLWQDAAERHDDARVLLSHWQERVLWHSIIEEESTPLIDSWAAAAQAQATASIARAHRLPETDDQWSDHDDSRVFHGWWRRFDSRCRSENWITGGQLADILVPLVSTGNYQPLLLLGFNEMPPALKHLFAQMGRRSIRQLTPVRPSAEHQLHRVEGIEQELEQAVRWARGQLEQVPQQSIGIVVPDLASRREVVERTVDNVLFPASALDPVRPARRERAAVAHLYAPLRLASAGPIADALRCLTLIEDEIALTVASAILRSPFLAGASAEMSLRAAADLQLRNRRDLTVSFGDLARVTQRCPELNARLRRLGGVLPRPGALLGAAAWSRLFSKLLETLGWPGAGEQNGAELDIVSHWTDALRRFSSLNLVRPALTAAEALDLLRRTVREGLPPAAGSGAVLHFVEPEQAEHVSFDAAWVCGLAESSWPPRARTWPLVPLALQRANRFPAVGRDATWQRARSLTETLASCASLVIGSYSAQPVEGTQSAWPHPLAVNAFGKSERPAMLWQGYTYQELPFPRALESVIDDQATAAVPGQVRGGTRLVRSQAICPFQAFALFRLHAAKPEDGVFGYDARDRGVNIHRSLEHFWRAVRTQAALRDMTEAELRAAVCEAVRLALREESESSRFHRQMQIAERRRLENLLQEWLVLEKRRIDPFTVALLEDKQSWEAEGLTLSVRVDRVDRLANGRCVLIDYKSGTAKTEAWLGDRLEEPQLPMYASALGDELQGVYFAQVGERLRWCGIGRSPLVPGDDSVAGDWERIRKGWQQSTRQLAASFLAGWAAVDPKQPSHCEVCAVRPVCRIDSGGGAR